MEDLSPRMPPAAPDEVRHDASANGEAVWPSELLAFCDQ
jgi:hypothetical protein